MVIWTLGRTGSHTVPDAVNKVGEDTGYCFYLTEFAINF